MKNILCTVISIFSLVISPIAASAQVATGGTYVLEQTVIAGGGGSNSTGGTFSLDGTIGQAVAGNALTGGDFAVTSGFWNFTPPAIVPQGFEGDLASRPNGDGVLLSNDVVQMRRFFNGLDQPFQSNEFQRADAAPFSTRGDGFVLANDVVQVRRYVNGLDGGLQSAGGPSALAPIAPPEDGSSGQALAVSKEPGKESPLGSTRVLRVESTSGTAGQNVTVNIRVDAVGDEAEYGLRILYDSTRLTFVSTGAGNTGAGVRSCNGATVGRVNCSIGAFPLPPPTGPGGCNVGTDPDTGEICPGNNYIITTITFAIAAGAPSGTTPLNFDPTPAPGPSTVGANASNDAATLLAVSATNGTVTVTAPTAARVAVGGRVLTADGRGITNVRVTITDQAGTSRSALTSSFGYFRFDDVEAGQIYIIGVRSKIYQFENPEQVVFVGDEITGLTFNAFPQ